jgi:hypothetical protein
MPSLAVQGAYRNYQLITSGLINPMTPMIIDTNYDPSYTMFQLQLTAFSLNGNGYISLNFDNTFSLYSNIISASTSAVILSDDTGAQPITDEFNGEYTIWWPNVPTPPQSAVYISGFSTYRVSGGGWFRYQVFARAFPPSRGGGIPSPFIALSGSGGLSFNGGVYLMTGINGRGASLLSTSTQGG